MTREEIRQEAEERVNICTPYHTGSFIQGYIAGAEPRENKIADIKANCDLAIEGRDIKIKELEKENAELKKEVEKHKWNDIFLEDCAGYDKKIAEEYTTLQERIEELENKNKKLESDFRICEKNADTYYDQLTIAKDLIHQFLIQNPISDWLPKKAERFLKEIEK